VNQTEDMDVLLQIHGGIYNDYQPQYGIH
jgi:hypothetical protein